MSITDISRWREVGQAHGEVFGLIRPATSMLVVSALIDPARLVEIEVDAVVPSTLGLLRRRCRRSRRPRRDERLTVSSRAG